MGGNERLDHVLHAAAGEIVVLEIGRSDVGQTGLQRLDFGVHDHARVDLPQPHADQLEQADVGVELLKLALHDILNDVGRLPDWATCSS